MARRMLQRAVRFVQVYHNNWTRMPTCRLASPASAGDVDPASWGSSRTSAPRHARRTLVIWGGEFGRTIYSQGA